MSDISTHVLDTSVGLPARGVAVVLERRDEDRWRRIGAGTTDDDGRLTTLLPQGSELRSGTYRLAFDTGSYFSGRGLRAFFPAVTILFEVTDPAQDHHVPLLLSPYGYATYRGS